MRKNSDDHLAIGDVSDDRSATTPRAGITPVGPSELSFYANDQLLGTRTSKQLGAREGLSTTWESGSATSVTLELVNANPQPNGNDFGVDDVFLGIESSVNPPC